MAFMAFRLGNTFLNKTSRMVFSNGGTCFRRARAARADSRMAPYSTPVGQASSQARQPRHKSNGSAKSDRSWSLPSAAIFTRLMRPRGEWVSLPMVKYVGQEVIQDQNCTHRFILP